MENKQYTLGTKVKMKKNHPCGGDIFTITRLGADIKIECDKCKHSILLPRIDFNKKIKKILEDVQ